jgi:transcriptional regulator of acetoin/glycerol metabolism
MPDAAAPPPKTLTIAEVIEAHIRQTLPLFDWNFSAAARALDIDRRTLYRCAKRYQIERPLEASESASPEETASG